MTDEKKLRLLAVDDEQSSLNAINRTLRREYDIIMSLNGQSALEALKTEDVAIILADQRMPQMTGVEFFQRAIELCPQATRILITGYSDIEATIQAINDAQIFYYIHKPWEPDDLRIIVKRAAEQYQLKQENARLLEELQQANQHLQDENLLLHQEVERQFAFEHIIGKSTAMDQVFGLMKKVIPTATTVLLLGETGTGKELIARAIHYNGPRKDKIFAAQNCGALPDTLLESELFGHVKGAFTGATNDKKGLFEIADGGTVFLDEVADTSPAMQQRLLRVLQEGEIHPVGAEHTINVDVRIVSAANKDLAREVRDGKFREDLFYRLNVFPIRIPPLRERREDIPLLSNFFLKRFAMKQSKAELSISEEALTNLMGMEFPGNVRQLENLVERAVTLSDEGTALSSGVFEMDVPLRSESSGNDADIKHEGQTLKEITESMERYYIGKSLEEYRGNISRVAEHLGLSRLGLHKKMQRYGIDASRYKHR